MLRSAGHQDLMNRTMYYLIVMHQGLIGSSAEGQVIYKNLFLEARKNYCKIVGFNPESGQMTHNKLLELGLGWVINYLS